MCWSSRDQELRDGLPDAVARADVLDLSRETARRNSSTASIRPSRRSGCTASNVCERAAGSNRACGSSDHLSARCVDGTWDRTRRPQEWARKNALDTPGDRRSHPRPQASRPVRRDLIVWAGELTYATLLWPRRAATIIPKAFRFGCGGVLRGGTIYGATDELGINAVEKHLHGARPARHDLQPDGSSITNV